mgnify:CR=1 FL=1
MSDVIAKRYTKALIEKFDKSELDVLVANLKVVADAFKVDKFNSIINSPIVSKEKKEELIFSLFEKSLDSKFSNFLKLLSENKRFNLIPEILSDIETKVAAFDNRYRGVIYSSDKLLEDEIKKIEEIFSKKFDANISLEHSKGEYNGIKVDIEELGVEISFSMDRLKHNMSEYILKAI